MFCVLGFETFVWAIGKTPCKRWFSKGFIKISKKDCPVKSWLVMNSRSKLLGFVEENLVKLCFSNVWPGFQNYKILQLSRFCYLWKVSQALKTRHVKLTSRMVRSKKWVKGFLGFLGFLGFNAFKTGNYSWLLWFLWFIWFYYFKYLKRKWWKMEKLTKFESKQSAPCFSKSVAKLCLGVWGVTFFFIPAFLAAFFRK